jgi:hypothetical protein
VEQTEGDKRRLNSSYSPEVLKDFCRKHPLWDQFFQFLGSAAFLRDLNAMVRLPLYKSRGLSGLRHWSQTVNHGSLTAIIKTPVTMQFEFSRLRRGSFVPPHTDDQKKLVSLLLYFPDPKWQENYGGDTEFYRAKNLTARNNWNNQRVSFEDLIPFSRAPFVANRLVAFVKSKNSYHGVQPITCPDGMARDSLNINVNRI